MLPFCIDSIKKENNRKGKKKSGVHGGINVYVFGEP